MIVGGAFSLGASVLRFGYSGGFLRQSLWIFEVKQ